MAEVDANHASRLHVDHEVGEMAISDAQNPVADTQQSVGADEVGAQGQEGLGTVAHFQKSSPKKKKKRRAKCLIPSFTLHERLCHKDDQLTSADHRAQDAALW